MEDEAVCCGCTDRYHGHRAVSAVAAVHEAGCVVSQYGHARLDWVVFRHGHCPLDPIRHHNVRDPARPMAVPEFIRGRGLLRLVPAYMGMAGGTSTLFHTKSTNT